MPRLQSRGQREAEFLDVARNMYGQLEEWYDQHPAASFGEIETEARRLRRELMGAGLAVLINGRDTGFQLAPPRARNVRSRWRLSAIGPGGCRDWKGKPS